MANLAQFSVLAAPSFPAHSWLNIYPYSYSLLIMLSCYAQDMSILCLPTIPAGRTLMTHLICRCHVTFLMTPHVGSRRWPYAPFPGTGLSLVNCVGSLLSRPSSASTALRHLGSGRCYPALTPVLPPVAACHSLFRVIFLICVSFFLS
jgi:hypothetical protein